NVLREVYLNRLLMNNMPSDFPSEEQLRQFFEENREDMVLAEQVPVWQIFLQVREGMDDTEISALAAEAERISQAIRDNALDFATAAEQYSQHQPSQGNGGYMGLLKVSELVPGISDTLLELDEGVVSSPLRTEMGFHILMRGKITPARELGYEQAREQIHNHLLNQAQNRIRNQVTQKVQESFPVEVEESEIDAWRNSLRSAPQ
ncbi:MAG: peptidylprolyl isomerase, partial [Gammaproteobacteria bacterium]